MKPTILVVDDEAPIRNMLAFSLNRAEMNVELAAGGDEALDRLSSAATRPDLIVMDWMMPGLDGLQLTRTLRETPSLMHIPIIMLTARGNERDRTSGLDSGADDYVVKPFSTRELISRVRAVLRRAQANAAPAAAAEVLEVGGLRLFMSAPGRAWSRAQLLAEIWGDGQSVEERTVDVHIRRLRKALEGTGHANFVQTVRGHGYRFSDVV